MTRRRVVALAQALTMIMLLLPGPTATGPVPVAAAPRPADPGAVNVFDASGKGIGCQAGTRKYKGPGLPKDPPWPPGAEPTPSPTPEALGSPGAGAEAPDASAGTPADPSEEAPGASTAPPEARLATTTVAATGLRPVQAATDPAATPPTTDPAAAQPTTEGLITGIDVSHHNGDIDYARVRDAGHRFVFAKATQDVDFLDPMFPTNVARARQAGLAVGAYHFFDYTLDGRTQADHFLDRLEAVGGIEDALPPVVDVECWRPIGPSIHAVSATRLRDFVDRVYERTGRLPIVYTSVHMWREVVGNAEGFEDLPLWAACWECEPPPSLAPGWDAWAFWQTGLTRIPDVGRLDGNYFGGSPADLDALRLRPFAIEDGAAATARQTVVLDLGGRAATHLRTSPDGETWGPWRRAGTQPTAELPAEEGEHTIHVQLRNGSGTTAPVVSDSIVLDRTAPGMSEVALSLREGPLDEADWLPLGLAWEASDAAGLADGAVVTECETEGSRQTVAPGSAAPGATAAWQADAWVAAADACSLTAISQDVAGNSASETTGQVSLRVSPAADASGSVEGHQAGVIARRGPDAGRAVVLLDGEAVGLVDLYAPEAGPPEVVFVATLPGGRHEMALEPTDGGSDPEGLAPAVEGFVSLSLQAAP